VSTNITKSRKVREAVYTAPYLIPLYLRKFNPKITKGILYDMVPFRSSIEIECFGSIQMIQSILQDKLLSSLDIMNLYGLKDYCEDLSPHANRWNRDYILPDRLEQGHFEWMSDRFPYPDASNHIFMNYVNRRFKGFSWDQMIVQNEHRISICNYTQLLGLYKILEDMKKYCYLNPISGVHVHVDITKFYGLLFEESSSKHKDRILAYLYSNTFLNRVYEIFDSNYTGNYNERGFSPSPNSWETGRSCHTWIRFNQPGQGYTIEFRIGGMTFEYETIVQWIVKCNSIVKELYSLLGTNYRNAIKLG